MTDQPRTPSPIAEELNKMGKLLVQAVQAAWESEERKKLEAELTEGLRKISDEVTAAAKKAQAEKIATEVKEHDIAEEVRKGLLVGLEAINQELGKLAERLEPKKKAESETPGDPAQ